MVITTCLKAIRYSHMNKSKHYPNALWSSTIMSINWVLLKKTWSRLVLAFFIVLRFKSFLEIKKYFLKNYTIRELELLKQFIFVEILELFDLKWKGYTVPDTACNRFHVLPRFSRPLPCKKKYLMANFVSWFLDMKSLEKRV